MRETDRDSTSDFLFSVHIVHFRKQNTVFAVNKAVRMKEVGCYFIWFRSLITQQFRKTEVESFFGILLKCQ